MSLPIRLFSWLNDRPPARRWIWKQWYRYLSRRFRADDWTFMNYGLAPSEPAAGNPVQLRPEDEPDRTWIALYQHVTQSIDLTGRAVLEVGSGRGGGASYLARYRGPARMVGLDISDSAVALCRQRHRAHGLSFRQGDAEALPFATGEMDVVVNVESSHCYGSLPKFLAEVRRVLRPGGHFLYADFRASGAVDGWLADLRAAGFIERSRQDITAGVVKAIEDDNQRRMHLIERTIPRPLLPTFRQFAGVPGSLIYQELQTRGLIYLSFVLQTVDGNDN
jgi:ubiquinone/menaquinone biosynthesis C-methylase UbiE